MDQLRKHILNAVEPLTAAIDQFIRGQPDTQIRKWRLCMAWPVEIAAELACRVAILSPRGLSNDNVDRLIASLATRYLFDLLANICVMLTTEPEDAREKLQLEWMRLRDVVVFGDGTYGIPMDHLPVKTSNRLQKISGFRGMKVPKYNHDLGKNEPIESVAVGHKSFLFEDPWDLSMAEKVEAIPVSSREYFLDRWKMYSHIAHASAFSIWPTWMYPVPVHDTIQCLAILLRVVGNFIGHKFDSKAFMEQAWVHIDAEQSAPHVQV